MAPVDYVAKAIIRLSLDSANNNKCFNVCSPTLFSYAKLFSSLKAFGYTLQSVPYEQFRAQLREATCTAGISACRSFF